MWFFDKLRKKSMSVNDLNKLVIGSFISTSGITVNHKNALQISSVFSCIKVLSESIGMLPVHLYRQSGTQKQHARDHNLFDILHNQPNDYMTSQEWLELVITHQCLRGVHYSYINRTSSGVSELLPMNPDSVQPIMSDNHELTYKVTFKNGATAILENSDVLALRTMTLDGYTPISPIQMSKDCLGLAKATETHGASLFKNGASPIGGFKTEKNLNDEQFERLQKTIESHQGNGATFKPLILEAGLEWNKISITPQDAQYLETRNYQRSEICGIFRVPPHMIGDLEKATFSNIEELGLQFVAHSLMPYLTRIEQRANMQLLTKRERKTLFVKFNVNALLRGNMKARSEFYWKMLQCGSLSPNDIRILEDMNPREGGDIYLTPINMTTNPLEDKYNDDKTKATRTAKN